MGLRYWQHLKNGQKIPLHTPLPYYTDAYVNWAKQAIQTLATFKNNLFINEWKLPNGDELKLPIKEPVVMTAVFFISDQRVVDISNLIEAPQDALIGKVGGFMDKHRQKNGEKFIEHFNHDTYKIISDDNRFVLRNLGGSTVMYDPQAPRTEIFISSFDLTKWKQVMDIWHPGLQLGNTLEVEQLSLDLGSLYSGLQL